MVGYGKIVSCIEDICPSLTVTMKECVPTYFHTPALPSISLAEYVQWLVFHGQFSDECIVGSLIYLDRLVASNKEFVVNYHSIHKLFLSSLLVSAKFTDDCFYTNCHYAAVGGVPLWELNLLESQFLMLIGYRCFISSTQYKEFSKRLSN